MKGELRKVATCFKANKLSLNISKTKYSLFHSIRKKMYQKSYFHYTLTTFQSKEEFVTKFLGVYLDKNISWKHINIGSTKVSKNIRTLYRTRCILSKFLRKQLYFSFINCYLNYAYMAGTSTIISKLQTLYRHQKHAASIINFDFCKIFT